MPRDCIPDLAIEDACATWAAGPVCGIDEAGRGPWAGPVVAAAVILDRTAIPEGIDDSKRLGPAQRAALFDEIMGTAMVGVGAGSVEEIERLNVLAATDLAMARALDALAVRPALALVDGNWKPRTISLPVRPIVRGDARSLSIAAASIVAKVTRDRVMHRLDAEFPGYGWITNAGYGTAEHRAALARLGITVHHRRGWAPIRALLAAAARKA